jgi:hypothetical protein
VNCFIKCIWDEETDRWHSETDDNLCLTLEAASFDVLVERLRIAAPEMLELNCGYKGPIHLSFETEREETLNMDQDEPHYLVS